MEQEVGTHSQTADPRLCDDSQDIPFLMYLIIGDKSEVEEEKTTVTTT